jgi:hypothetical protein
VTSFIVAKAVAESLDGQVLAPRVLKGARLDIAEQIAHDIPRSNRQALIAVVQRTATGYHEQKIFLADVPGRREDRQPDLSRELD